MTDYTRHPVVPDNVAPEKTLLYGPHGEALVKQVPRQLGFRPPPDFGQQTLSSGDLPRDLQASIDALETGHS